MRSKIVIQKPTTTSIGLVGLDFLTEVYANTIAGDLVIVYPGTYDLGANGIQLKDGVNWHFFPGVIITSSNAGGTFYDNNVAVKVRMEGKPRIKSSVVFGLQNAGSEIDAPHYYDTPTAYRAKSCSFTIPAITAGTRQVVSVNLGSIGSPSRVLINSIVQSSYNDQDAEAGMLHKSYDQYGWSPNGQVNGDAGIFVSFGIHQVGLNGNYPINQLGAFLIHESYNKTIRCAPAGASYELDSSDVAMGSSVFYDDNNGTLIGYYSFGGAGAFQLDAEIYCESMWLDNSTDDTVLKIALYNRDGSANTQADKYFALFY